jgi:thiol:disulfide interchange protein
VHQELSARYVPVKYDVSKGNGADRKAQKEWNANAFPTVIILAPDGSEVKRFVGEPLPTVDEFLATIKSVK